MQPRIRTKSRIVSDKITVYTIWDNFNRHEAELRTIGATDDQIEELRTAAQAVSVEEESAAAQSGRNPEFNQADLADILCPYTCCNDWIIMPPSIIARRWAMTAVMAVTGGREPTTPIGVLHSLVAGLLVLKLYGEGQKGKVLALVSSDAIADILPEACDAFAGCPLDAIALDYMSLMGMEKKRPALNLYNQIRERIEAACSSNSTTPSSPGTSQPKASASARPGQNTSKRRQPSSVPARGNRTDSTR